MNILDDRKSINQLDTGHSYESIKNLPDQCQAAWDDVASLAFPSSYSTCSSIIFSGMGGSAYGGRIIKNLYFDKLNIPVDIISDYHLPKYANQNTLVIAASYSGNTEETISCINDALRIGCKIIGISSGGKLFDLLSQAHKPVYKFNPVYNPSLQPRMGQGYMQIGQIAILNKLGYLKLSDQEFTDVIKELNNNLTRLDIATPQKNNIAKHLAETFQYKIVNIIGAEFLEGAIHSIRNPFHETGKHFANNFILPELNHHLMEGLSYPSTNKKNLLFFLIGSNLYSERIKKRMNLTEKVIKKNQIKVVKLEMSSISKIGQVFELIQIGSFITFYLAMLHHLDPVKIPWVDYFKDKLK